MSETPRNPDDNEELIPLNQQDNEVDAQFIILLSSANVAREWLERTSVDPEATDEEVTEAKLRKQEADQRLVEFKIEHGLISPPVEEKDLRRPIEELGLDPNSQEDLQLYVDSGGRPAIAKLMIKKRDLEKSMWAGELPREQFDEQESELNSQIDRLRQRYEDEDS